MREDLKAIKTAIEAAMANDIDADETIPEELIESIASLHSGLDRLENPEKYEGDDSDQYPDGPI